MPDDTEDDVFLAAGHGRRVPSPDSHTPSKVRKVGRDTRSPSTAGMPSRIEEIRREAGWSETYTRLAAIVTIALLVVAVAIYTVIALDIIPGR